MNPLHRAILHITNKEDFLKCQKIIEQISELAIKTHNEDIIVFLKLKKAVTKRLGWWKENFKSIILKAEKWELDQKERLKSFSQLFKDDSSVEIIKLEDILETSSDSIFQTEVFKKKMEKNCTISDLS